MQMQHFEIASNGTNLSFVMKYQGDRPYLVIKLLDSQLFNYFSAFDMTVYKNNCHS